MRLVLYFLLSLMPLPSIAEVFRCGEPKGIVMYSNDRHKIHPDGFASVQPVVIVDEKEMTIVWGDSQTVGGAEKVWKTVIFHRDPESISGVVMDAGSGGSAAMLYTVDVKRGYLYMSSHRVNEVLNASTGATYVSKCTK